MEPEGGCGRGFGRGGRLACKAFKRFPLVYVYVASKNQPKNVLSTMIGAKFIDPDEYKNLTVMNISNFSMAIRKLNSCDSGYKLN